MTIKKRNYPDEGDTVIAKPMDLSQPKSVTNQSVIREKIKKIYHFFRLLGRDYYGERIGVLFAWALADAFAQYDEEFKRWRSL